MISKPKVLEFPITLPSISGEAFYTTLLVFEVEIMNEFSKVVPGRQAWVAVFHS